MKDILRKWKKQNGEKNGDDNYVFTSYYSTMPLDSSAPRCWHDILKDAGITNFRWHDMRHTYASLLVQKGTDIVTIKELLGHADIKTTSIYLHSSVQQKYKYVKKLDELVSA